MELDILIECNEISKQCDTLKYSLFQILEILEKEKIKNINLIPYLTREELLLGYVLFHWNKDNVQISHIAVRPEYQRKGIGKNLIERIFNWYGDDMSYTADIKIGNTNSEELFKSLGFKLYPKASGKSWKAYKEANI